MPLDIKILTQIDQVSASSWNALVRDANPLIRHEFLSAMEHHGCVGSEFGWIPRHIVIYEDEQLVAAMPLYEKHNSYGEFVFDHSWADAYQRAGLQYYPKLVSAVPYTPATGQRLLALTGRESELWALLYQTAQSLAKESGYSGVHCLFPETQEQAWLSQHSYTRQDCQFHWHNNGYQDFAEFLQTLTAKKRKNIRQERRKVRESGVTIRVLDGHSASERDWQHFAAFYAHTFDEKWGIATFNLDFFMEVAQQLPQQIVLVLADAGQECVAGALMYRSDTHLYGRHWGATRFIDQLHFEVCYYQGIEYCIEHNLQIFEPGAQGEHKISRGFVPTLTQSNHWLTQPHFASAIAAFTSHERAAVADYMAQLESAVPYKDAPVP